MLAPYTGMMTRTVAAIEVRKPRFGVGALALVLGLGLVSIGPAGAEDPPPQESSESSTPGSANGLKDKLASALHDDQDETHQGRPHWGPLYPSITVVSSGASVGPELQLWFQDLGGSHLDFRIAGVYSLRQYQYYTAQFGLLPQPRLGPPSLATSTTGIYPLDHLAKLSTIENHFVLYGSFRYRDYPQEDFFGQGLDSLVQAHTDFAMRDRLFEAVTGYHFSPRFALNFRAGLLHTSLAPGTDAALPQLEARFDSVEVPGLADPPEELMLTAGAMADLRDAPGNPHAGSLLMASVTRFADRDAGLFDFVRAAGEARFYLPLFSRKHVIAARALLSADSPDAGSSVPFYLQQSLGGSHVLRGYPPFRFRDDAVAAVSAEYRFEPVSRVELAAFYDAGVVAESVSALDGSHRKTSWGGGIRLKSKRSVLFRFDVARSPETTRYLVMTSPAF